MKKWLKRFSYVILVFSFFGFVFGVSLWLSLPSPEEIRGCLITSMYQVELCPTSKNYSKLKSISNYLRRAVIAAEDSNFYQHDGFDWEAIQSSFEKNLAEGKYVRGGSTITQQLAKNMFLTRNKTLWRKFKEALITKEIEKTLTKDEILERYFNVVQFGKNLFGVKKAAQFYFKKQPSQLSLNESVFLVFLLPSPEKYSYSFFRKELTFFARRRMKTLLTHLLKAGRVSEGEYRDAVGQLAYFPGTPPQPEPVLESTVAQGDSGASPVEGSNSTNAGPTENSSSPASETLEAPEEIPTLDQLESAIIEEN